MRFTEFLEYLKDNFPDPAKRGYEFERAICNYFKVDKLYNKGIKKIWLWKDFPYKKFFSRGHDVG
ncbi:MAG: hypothetical protein LBF12_00160, partial [Christensenellaceae bacterium]|nr:hypothetical protein [Christensenellaceae bacterium]